MSALASIMPGHGWHVGGQKVCPPTKLFQLDFRNGRAEWRTEFGLDCCALSFTECKCRQDALPSCRIRSRSAVRMVVSARLALLPAFLISKFDESVAAAADVALAIVWSHLATTNDT